MNPAPLERDCSVFRTVAAIGDAWSWMVLREAIFDGVSRFDAFQQRLGIARSTLTKRLDQLVESSVFQHHGFDYVLTDRGEDFLGCLLTARRWGDRWCTHPQSSDAWLVHHGCGRAMHAQLSCSHCDVTALARDVSLDNRPEPVRRLPGQLSRHRIAGLDLLERNRPCSIARTLQVIGDLWSALIIQECFFGTHRFDEFQRRLSIASNILSHRLTRLTELGILSFPDAHNGPGYHLTEKGLDLYPIPLAMLTWGDRWLAAGDPPVKLSHRRCGNVFVARLSCSHCGGSINRRAIEIAQQAHADSTRRARC